MLASTAASVGRVGNFSRVPELSDSAIIAVSSLGALPPLTGEGLILLAVVRGKLLEEALAVPHAHFYKLCHLFKFFG